MPALRKSAVALFVDRSNQQWVVLDQDGNFWMVPSYEENPWSQRQPYYPNEQTDLEPVPGHYKYMLGLPT